MSEIIKSYELLGLEPGSSTKEVKKAYRALIKKWHPDRYRNDPDMEKVANEKVRDFNKAYEIIEKYIESGGGGYSNTRQSKTTSYNSSDYASQGYNYNHPSADALAEKAAEKAEKIQFAFFCLILIFIVVSTIIGTSIISIPNSISLGSSSSVVSVIQGKPDNVSGNIWNYGKSRIFFEGDRVIGYNNTGKNLKLNIMPSGDVKKVLEQGYFTLGSNSDEVLAIQGAPDVMHKDYWIYGNSKVYFTFGLVNGYNSYFRELKVRPVIIDDKLLDSKLPVFAKGSTKQDVLRVQGIPSIVDGSTWYYLTSTVSFYGDKVYTFSNRAYNLRTR